MTSLALGTLRVWPLQAEKSLRAVYAFLVSLIPLGLSFWYFKSIYPIPHKRIYFTYTDALLFLADGLMVCAVLIWLIVKIKNGLPFSSLQDGGRAPLRAVQVPFIFLPLAFCLLAVLSILWSRDWRISLYTSFHIALIFLFIISLRDWSHAWRFVLLGFCAALSIELITGMIGFLKQSTTFLAPLAMNWPGPLDPSVRGAVVVQLPNGESFLRAYGTLPHPNILGGLALILLLGPVALFMRREKPNHFALLLLIPGVSLLALTFSRSAWLALVFFGMVLAWKWKCFDRTRLAICLFVITLSFVLTLFPYRELVEARTVSTTSHSEEFSFLGRAWLNGEALRMARAYPLTGVGMGAFIIQLARDAGEGYVIEPAHNIFLLAGAELGLPGLLLVIALCITFASHLFKTHRPNAILVGAALTGLGVISLFDHYLWTIAPGRLMLGLVIGLFLGQDLSNDT
jgi:O-antigen ligase